MRYSIYSASFVHAGGTLDMRQLNDQGMTANANRSVIRPGGSLDPSGHMLSTADPTSRFATMDLLSLLSLNSGTAISAGLYCSGGHTARYQQREEGGAFKAGAAHLTQVTQAGFLNIQDISVDADSQEGAQMNLDYTALSVDGSDPFTQTKNVDFATAPTPLFNSRYYMGGVVLADTAPDHVTSLIRQRVVPGLTYTARRVDGGVFRRRQASSITARDPVIELTYLDVSGILVDRITNFFHSALGHQLDVYFQRGTTGNDGRVPIVDNDHIKISAPTGSWGADDLSVTGTDDATVTVRVLPTTLTAAVGQAIP